ncbi:hypothetical protein CUMW_220570 [Citrus unshiu]|uniref:Ribosome biogenesis protein BMS1/TSR1 C-terminal domain-containing protein n=1 Tax=Citrus unshiu TaxID=55188 RepID=A0A2H5QDR6_CITUN|nr:hypothetical protein CUMW_220570 [Citrus unshiu]
MNIAELNDLDEVTRLEGFQTGTYLGMEIHDVPFEMVEYFDPCHPVLVGGIGLGKQNVGYVQARLKRHRWWHKKVLKSRDPIIVSIGWRRIQTVPVYAIEDRNGRHRMLKYTPEHMHSLAMFWGPLAPPQMGSCCPKFIQQSVMFSMLFHVLDFPHTAYSDSMEEAHVFYLFMNWLSGSISREVGRLSFFNELSLCSNFLEGSNPLLCVTRQIWRPCMISMPFLVTWPTWLLYLDINTISGSILDEIRNLKSLFNIRLGDNTLSGSIPLSLGNLTNLATLYLDSNALSELTSNTLGSSIPLPLGNLTNLVVLELSDNKLSGLIPPSFGNLTNLTTLYVYKNSIFGSILDEIGNLKSLSDINLSLNKLNGSIPLSLTNLTNSLEVVCLSSNHIVGEIPLELRKHSSVV